MSKAEGEFELLRGCQGAVSLTAPALVLVVPLVGFLQYNEYDFFSGEALIMISALFGIGLIGGLVIRAGRRVVTAIVYASVLTLFLDLQFESLP